MNSSFILSLRVICVCVWILSCVVFFYSIYKFPIPRWGKWPDGKKLNWKTDWPKKDKNELVITYCNFGNRSGQTAKIPREKGYKQAFVLEEGIENYFSKIN